MDDARPVRPYAEMAEVDKLYSGIYGGNIWRFADFIRDEWFKRDKKAWDKRVFIPSPVWQDAARKTYVASGLAEDTDALWSEMMIALAVAAWRPRQDIIRLDPDLADTISGTRNTLLVPSRLFLRLPAWSVYFDCPACVANKPYDGFFAFLDQDEPGSAITNDEDALAALTLQILFLSGDASLSVNFNLDCDSIQESLCRNEWHQITDAHTSEKWGFSPEELVGPGLLKALNIILYTCMHGFGDTREYDGKQQSAEPKKTKRGWRLFPAEAPKYHIMGQKLGEHLRQIRQSEPHRSRGSVTPHVRAAHWHNYWIGSMSDPEKRRLEPRWLYPIPVNLKPDDDSVPGW